MKSNTRLIVTIIVLAVVVLCLVTLVVYSLYQTAFTAEPLATVDVEVAIAQTVAAIPTKTLAPSSTPEPTNSPTPTVPPTDRPTRTPVATYTPIPTFPTRTPFPTGVAKAPGRNPGDQYGEPTFIDRFETADNWTLFDNGCFRSVVNNDHYVMTGKLAPSGLCWEVTWPRIQDFYLEAIVKANACEGRDRYGIFFRGPTASSGYFFGLTCDQEYFLIKWDGENRESTLLVDYTPYENIQFAGQYNRLGVHAAGHQLSLYINGSQVERVFDDSYLNAGLIGLFISPDVTAGFIVEFDQLAYWAIE